MNEVTEILQKIKERPQIYLGQPSLWRLKHFLDGYVVCLRAKKNDYSLDFFLGFNAFVAEKYHITKSLSVEGMIYSIVEDDEEAFYKYFELLEEFKEANEK